MDTKINIGIIGGTGVYRLPGIEDLNQMIVKTDYGDVCVNVGEISGKQVAFLTRHGENHSTSPGQINYQANIMAMKQLGVKQIIATACSGSLNPRFGTGSLVMLEQFFEMTKNRKASFYENDGTKEYKIAHMDVTHPYCLRLTRKVIEAGKMLGITVGQGVTYCCMEGPRFETDAEIRMLRTLGADLVAQTQYPEVVLAREAEICYAAIGIISNMAAGIESDNVSAKELKANMNKMFDTVQSLLCKVIEIVPDEECGCQHILEESFL